jgi:hypothetical protein
MTDSSYANRRALATFIFMLFISTMQQKHQIQRINSEMIEHKSIEELAANESKGFLLAKKAFWAGIYLTKSSCFVHNIFSFKYDYKIQL